MTPSRSEVASRAPRRRTIAAAALAALVLPTAAQAEVVVNENEFRDWVGRCETETTTGEVVCFIYTGRVAEVEGQELAARIVVGIGENLEPIVYLDVPDVAEPANGFMLRVDNQEPFSGRFATCSTGWCHTEAAGEIAQVLIQQFRAGSEATASFILEEQDLQVDMPMSLLGFTAAYTQLLQIHEQAAAAAQASEEAAESEEPEATEPVAQEPPAEEPAGDTSEPEGTSEPEATEPEAAQPESEPEATEPEAAEPGSEPAGDASESPAEADESEAPAPE